MVHERCPPMLGSRERLEARNAAQVGDHRFGGSLPSTSDLVHASCAGDGGQSEPEVTLVSEALGEFLLPIASSARPPIPMRRFPPFQSTSEVVADAGNGGRLG